VVDLSSFSLLSHSLNHIFGLSLNIIFLLLPRFTLFFGDLLPSFGMWEGTFSDIFGLCGTFSVTERDHYTWSFILWMDGIE
jgi:hypothetical protein